MAVKTQLALLVEEGKLPGFKVCNKCGGTAKAVDQIKGRSARQIKNATHSRAKCPHCTYGVIDPVSAARKKLESYTTAELEALMLGHLFDIPIETMERVVDVARKISRKIRNAQPTKKERSKEKRDAKRRRREGGES